MQIKQDPISGLWCREDGAVLLPPSGTKFKKFRWVFGTTNSSHGYKTIMFHRKTYSAHQVICRAFHGLAPIDKPFVDHINRIKSDNRPENLHWVDRKENNDNTGRVDQAIEKYGVRYCEDRAAYGRAWRRARCEEVKAHRKKYFETHREEYAARAKKYRERRKSEAA